MKLGGGRINKGLQKFLLNHGKILSFEAIWDDQTYGGQINKYKIKYYLDEDKVEILEIRVPNSGKSPFPMFLKKGKLLKSLPKNQNPGL